MPPTAWWLFTKKPQTPAWRLRPLQPDYGLNIDLRLSRPWNQRTGWSQSGTFFHDAAIERLHWARVGVIELAERLDLLGTQFHGFLEHHPLHAFGTGRRGQRPCEAVITLLGGQQGAGVQREPVHRHLLTHTRQEGLLQLRR